MNPRPRLAMALAMLLAAGQPGIAQEKPDSVSFQERLLAAVPLKYEVDLAHDVAFSPDGRTVAYRAPNCGGGSLT